MAIYMVMVFMYIIYIERKPTMKPVTLNKVTFNDYTWTALDKTVFSLNNKQLQKICSITNWDYDWTEQFLLNNLKDNGLWIMFVTPNQDLKIKKVLGWSQPKRGF